MFFLSQGIPVLKDAEEIKKEIKKESLNREKKKTYSILKFLNDLWMGKEKKEW
jgi:hypothetical protein